MVAEIGLRPSDTLSYIGAIRASWCAELSTPMWTPELRPCNAIFEMMSQGWTHSTRHERMSPTHEAESSALTVSGTPKRSSPRKRWPLRCWWDSSLNPRNQLDASTARARAMRRYGRALSTGVTDPRRQPAPAGLGAARSDHFGVLWEFTATRSPASSQVTAPSPPKASEHFGHDDHFATLHPICTHPQGMNTHKALTALSCEYSPTRRHRVPLTAVHCR